MLFRSSFISGHSAWFNASNLVELRRLDAVVVVAVDNGLSEELLNVFGAQGLVKLAKEEDLSVVKFRLGHGCNITVFEHSDMVTCTGNSPIAAVTDIHIAAERHSNPIGISPTGAGYTTVMDAVDTTDISFVKTHSTFSKDNRIEEELIRQKFENIPIMQYKLRIGHTMGAATAIETAIAIQENSGKFLSLGAGMGNVFSAAVVNIL